MAGISTGRASQLGLSAPRMSALPIALTRFAPNALRAERASRRTRRRPRERRQPLLSMLFVLERRGKCRVDLFGCDLECGNLAPLRERIASRPRGLPN